MIYMDFKLALFKNDISSFNIPYIVVDNTLFFKGKDIATILGYADTKKAISNNVDNDDKHNLETVINDSQIRGESNYPLDYNHTKIKTNCLSSYLQLNELTLYKL